MIWIVVTSRVNHVSYAITGRNSEQSVHRIEYIPRYYHVPLPEQSAGILALLI